MNTDQRIATLERQLKALTLQLRGSPGVSNSGGPLSIRTMQLGFAAELTSTFDAETGYDWKRLRLVPPDFVDPGIQPTGSLAFDIGGSETLEVGTEVWMEPSPDAKGWIFVVSGSGGSSGTVDCSNLIGLIQSGSCFTLSLAAGVGSCACVAAQESNMSWNAVAAAFLSDDYFYGCPPGVVTTFCVDGAPRKYKIVVAGFTGGSTGFNGTYTVTWSSGETWTGTTAGVTATLVQTLAGTWSLTLDDGSNQPVWAVNSIIGCCDDLVLDLDDGDGTTDPPATLTAEVVTACGLGPAYTAYLDLCESDCDGPQPRLRMVPAGGSGAAAITLSRVGCTSTGGSFSTSNPIFCTDDVTECGDNSVIATVVCGACFERTVVVVPCSSCCSETEVLSYEMPSELCVTYENTTGPDCVALDGRVVIASLASGPAPDPMSYGFSGYASVTGYTVLSSGSIFDITGANQCGPADTVGNAVTYPVNLVFNSGSAWEYSISWNGSAWILTLGANTFTGTIVDHDAQTVSFNVTGFESYFGTGTLVFTIGGYPTYIYEYFDAVSASSAIPGDGGLLAQITVSPTLTTTKCYVNYLTNIVNSDLIHPCGIAYPVAGGTYSCQQALLTQQEMSGVCDFSAGGPIVLTDVPNSNGGLCTDAASRYTITYDPDTSGCDPNPPEQTFNCLDTGSCVDPGDGTGEFTGATAEADCNAACSGTPSDRCCGIEAGDPVNLLWNGLVYNSVWGTSGSQLTAFFTGMSGGDVSITCELVGTVLVRMYQAVSHGDVVTIDCGPPSVVYTFDKADFASAPSTDPVVTTTL